MLQVGHVAEPYTLRGRVVAKAGAPLANAEIVVVEAREAERSLRADSTGAFETTLKTRSAVLRVRSPGYEPRTVAVSIVGDSRQSTVTIELDPVPVKLATVAIADSASDVDVKLRDYYARKASNAFAHFVDGAEIEKRKPRVVSEMLRSLPGVVLSRRRAWATSCTSAAARLSSGSTACACRACSSTKRWCPTTSPRSRSTTHSRGSPRATSTARRRAGRFSFG